MPSRPFPPAWKHGSLEEVFPDIFFVTGQVRMMGAGISRNMVVVRDGGDLTLIHSLRLDDRGLADLDALGEVKHVVRIAGFHGMDDPFYKDRYGATVYNVKGQVYSAGFNSVPDPDNAYLKADVEVDVGDALPIEGARLITIPSAKVPEGLILLDREGGILISGDCLQNWARADEYFSWFGKVMMRAMKFIRPHNVGPGWRLGAAKPDVAEVKELLDLEFEHVLPVHGTPVIGGAKDKYRPRIESL